MIAAGWLWLKNLAFELKAVVRAVEVTARSENRKLELVGAIGTWPLTRVADWS